MSITVDGSGQRALIIQWDDKTNARNAKDIVTQAKREMQAKKKST